MLSLIGYRGCGKTTVGRALAARLGWAFVDSDNVIESESGKSIAAIFAEEGERAFRDLEERVVAELCRCDETVVSLGGGAVLREATRRRLADAGPVVWLTAPAEVLAERIGADQRSATQRPSLTGLSGLEEVRRVLTEREPIYAAAASETIDATDASPEALADQIAQRLGLRIDDA